MKNYIARWTITPAKTTLNYKSLTTNPAQVRLFNWTYLFSDGTRLNGQVEGTLDQQKNTLLNPTQIKSDYLDVDGHTVLSSWRNSDFLTFEATADGNDTVIVASNDNCVANSMCLVSAKTRQKAQVTDWGVQLVGETFNNSAWSITPKTSPITDVESAIKLELAVAPFFPFFIVRFSSKLPDSSKKYQLYFSPYIPFYWSFEL